MPNLEGYRAIERGAERVGWPTDYRTDLTVHDRFILDENAPDVFGWVLRKLGTYLLYPPCTREDRYWARVICRHTLSRFYWYDGEELHQVTSDEWYDLLGCGEYHEGQEETQ